MRITSRSVSEALHCELKTVDLDENPSYECLSYAWGSPDHQQPIRLAGKPVLIVANLFDFLQVYRQRVDRDWIWIDQL